MRAGAGFTTCLFLHMVYFFLNRKWQEANQKVQELQASQEARVDQEQRIKVSCSVSVPGLCLGDVTAPGPAPYDPWLFQSWGRTQWPLVAVSCLCPL